MDNMPHMKTADRIRKVSQSNFGGYNHSYSCGDGGIYDMENITGDLFPVISPRKRRSLCCTLAKPNGLFARDHLYWVDGSTLYEDGEPRGTVLDSHKTFVAFGPYIIILPDKVMYNTVTHILSNMEARISGVSVTIKDGTYADQPAAANTIHAPGTDWASIFAKGDAVKIQGCKAHPGNDKTLIVREISGNDLVFYEHSFVIAEGGDRETLTISRDVPDMDYVFECENRLWGCKGDTIFASKTGDPTNWHVFDGISTDSYAVDVGSAGDFTGGCFYLGYPCFFKENYVYKMYGDRPSNFQLMASARIGVQQGCGASLAVAGETLHYLSVMGMVSYNGGIPRMISAPFGTDRYVEAVAGTDGLKYYASMLDDAGEWTLFTYDTRTQLWFKEDNLHVTDFAWLRGLYYLDAEGNMWCNGDTIAPPQGASPEAEVRSSVEFGDFAEDSLDRKGVSRLHARVELDKGAHITFYVKYDSSGEWVKVKTITATQKTSVYMPLVLNRCDHYRIKIEGVGAWKLFSLAREFYIGSEQ